MVVTSSYNNKRSICLQRLEQMEEKSKRKVVQKQTLGIVSMMLVMMILSSEISPGLACSPSKDRTGRGCKDCVADQMNYGCPSCVPLLHCMAKCLWGGTPRTTCIQKCDCDGGNKPKLSDCKKCMSRCKCSCVT